ncbi:MAG: hypothetical protein A2Y12_05420 [Planctomycetes bacterium GWF2_42_9]|nr:MAG: hypothetical protein A2Y12_05420 [Planctomycetes bacterium GWF2_42_9]
MNMHWLDWGIVIALLIFVTVMAIVAKRYTNSVAAFLAADRCAGPYLLAISEGVATSGAISFVALFEMYYHAGFTAFWWNLMTMPLSIIVALTGWIIYRFRQTRAMTLAQFFEIRYSKKFRIFMGLVGFLSGIVNFGIFPAVGARFFLYFCGLPQSIPVCGIEVSLYVLIMIILLAISLFFTFVGGQVSILVTDFFQGMFSNIAIVVILITMFKIFNWSEIVEALSTAPSQASLLHPFQTSQTKDFNVWYFLIVAFGVFYTTMAWQGTQGFNCSAKSPHAARMGRILGTWRNFVTWIIAITLPVCAFTVMHHVRFASHAAQVTKVLSGVGDEKIQGQMMTPLVMAHILPVGIIGMMCAFMLVAFIANHEAYLHSWGSIFVQDVILPFRKKKITPEQHLRLLRFAIFGVAVFIFFFSLLFRQTEYILMFMAITGAIYTGGAGAAIIGGLYWKKGTTLAAWIAMILGSTIATTGIVIHQMVPNFFLNGQCIYFIAMVSSTLVYIVISLIGCKTEFNMDQMLHRGKYAIEEIVSLPKKRPVALLLDRLGINSDFTFTDKAIYFSTLALTLGLFAMFVIGTLYNFVFDVKTESWARFWQRFTWLGFALSIIVTVWFTIGGLMDMKKMFKALRIRKRNELDDGTVVDHHNLDEVTKTSKSKEFEEV